MIGFHQIVVRPEARGRGAGRLLMTSLLAWGHAQGASRAYIQVEADNEAAKALYRSLGLSEAYRYHYRVSP